MKEKKESKVEDGIKTACEKNKRNAGFNKRTLFSDSRSA